LVNENSERTRALIKSAEFQEFYDLGLGKDRVDDWTVEKDGKRLHQLFSRASGGQITGVRGGYMTEGFSGYVMADDWNKPDDMFSLTRRNKQNTRLNNTLRSRRATSETPFIFVQQRLHTDDSTSFLLSGKMGLNIDLHIEIPAIVNEEYLDSLPDGIRERAYKDVSNTEKVSGYWSYWPAKESIHDLLALRESDPYTFASQYLQSPESLDGGVFNPDAFIYYGDDEEADIPTPVYYEYRFITADTAQKTKERNDFSVFAEWGVSNGVLYRLSYFRGKLEARELRQTFESFCNQAWSKNDNRNGNLRKIYVEDKSSGTGLIQEVSSRLPISITAVQRNTDKLTRAMDAQPHQASGKVALPYGDPHNFEFVQEVASFAADDSHKHDDQTDVMIDAINLELVAKKTVDYSKIL
jgi:predicted phage terminase large subunit-like protein